MSKLKEILTALKKDKNYRKAGMFIPFIIISFIFSFYIVTQKPFNDVLVLIIFVICNIITITLIIYGFSYLLKSYTFTQRLLKEDARNPYKKIFRFIVIVAITCLVLYLLGYFSPKIIINSIFFIIIYVVYVFFRYNKQKPYERKKTK